MLQMESHVNIMDNSGVYTVKIISSYGKPFVTSSNTVLTAISSHRRGKSFNKKYLCLITTSKCFRKRLSGIRLKFDSFNGILLKDKETFLVSKFYGPTDFLCKKSKISKIHFLSRSHV